MALSSKSIKTCTSDFLDCLTVMFIACCKHTDLPHGFSSYVFRALLECFFYPEILLLSCAQSVIKTHADLIGVANLAKGAVIIYEWGGGGANPKIARTQNVPPLDNRALKICPPSKAVH